MSDSFGQILTYDLPPFAHFVQIFPVRIILFGARLEQIKGKIGGDFLGIGIDRVELIHFHTLVRPKEDDRRDQEVEPISIRVFFHDFLQCLKTMLSIDNLERR